MLLKLGSALDLGERQKACKENTGRIFPTLLRKAEPLAEAKWRMRIQRGRTVPYRLYIGTGVAFLAEQRC